MTRKATARAHANIALAKYWGKSDVALNLPAVPSLSITLEPLTTTTTVEFRSDLNEDEFWLDETRAPKNERERVRALLDNVRKSAKLSERAIVTSQNAFPTASGLASSASGFAALAAAATQAAGLPWELPYLSRLARQASASAARSVYGGFVMLESGKPDEPDLAAEPLAPHSHWNVAVVVALVNRARKPLGSTEAMLHTQNTSWYYPAWQIESRRNFERMKAAVLARDLETLGPLVEQSALAMHASMMAANPAVLYWQPSTLLVLHAVQRLRIQHRIPAWATMDAGPHVKVLCRADDANLIQTELLQLSGVEQILITHPGPGVAKVE